MKRYMKPHHNYRKEKLIVLLEELPDMDWFWFEGEIDRFDKLWKQEVPILEIAQELKRSEAVVFLLAFERVMRGNLKPREGWSIW